MAHILLVEDDPPLQVLYRLELTGAGHSVSIASTLEEAVKRLEEQLPTLIVLDLKLPDAKGINTLAAILNSTPAHIPIVVNSAYDYRTHLPKDYRVAYVVKSSDLSDLHATVQRFVSEMGHTSTRRARTRKGKSERVNPAH